jgi:hypothetical protein
MTDLQRKRLYFPVWRRAFGAAWQVEPSGRIIAAPDTADSDVREMIEGVAGSYAAAEVRGVTESDLRHGANALAIQRARSWRLRSTAPLAATLESSSSRHMDALSLDLFLALCHLLEDPYWLGDEKRAGLIQWEHPENLEVRRILRALDTRTSAGYAASICADRFGTRDYHTLNYESLASLYRLVLDRPKAWRPRGVRTPISDPQSANSELRSSISHFP